MVLMLSVFVLLVLWFENYSAETQALLVAKLFALLD